MLSPATADMDPQLAPEGCQAALQRTDHAGGDSRGVPVHSHYGAERLKPEGVRKTPQQLIAPVVMYDSLADHHALAGHPIGEPLWNMSAVQWEVGSPSASSHQSSCLALRRLVALLMMNPPPRSRSGGRLPHSMICSALMLAFSRVPIRSRGIPDGLPHPLRGGRHVDMADAELRQRVDQSRHERRQSRRAARRATA